MDAPNQWQPGRRHEGGRKFFGLIVAVIGLGFLLHNIFPDFWHIRLVSFGWPWILVLIGLAIGIKNNFRRHAWWILMLIGGAHIVVPIFFPDIPTHRFVWPGLLVGFGLAMIFGKHDRHHWKGNRHVSLMTNDADMLNIDVSFSGRKEIVTSKSFRGGVIRASFAGVELNLAGADNDGAAPMILDVHASFAGVEIIVPSHWELQNEIRPMMASIEDQRVIRTGDSGAARRLLILQGTCNFGSIELKSY